MATFINTIEEVRKFFPINQNIDFENISPSLNQAAFSYLRPLLGDPFFQELSDAYQNQTLSSHQLKIFVVAQMTQVTYGLYLALPEMNVNFGDMGLQELSDSEGTTAPARKWRYDNLKNALIEKADLSADMLLANLELFPQGTFPNWEASPAFTISRDLFINSTAELSEYVNISGSRRTWLALRRFLKQAEIKYILPLVCRDLFDAIKSEIRAGAISIKNQILLEKIRPALASFTIVDGIPNINVKFTHEGITSWTEGDQGKQAENAKVAELLRFHDGNSNFWSSEIKGYLEKNADDYPLWRDSSCCGSRKRRGLDNAGRQSFVV